MPVDPSAYVAPTARVHPEAIIGPRTKISEFVVIDHDVTIGADCLFEPYCYVKPWTTIGARNEFSSGVALGTDPLDKAFNGERSYLKIGSGNKIREHWTISRGTAPESITIVGDENFFMTSGHVAHNCIVGSYTVIASNTLVAGYAEVEDRAFLSGGVVVHQFSKIGCHVMVAGNVRVNSDLPPYFLYSDFNVSAKGLNIVGLKRCGFKLADINPLKTAYKLLYRSNLKLEDALARIELEAPTAHTKHLVEFIRASQRGICRE